MSLTDAVKEELSRLTVTKAAVRKAEVCALLRFAGGLHIVQGRVVIEAEVDSAATARRLKQALAELYAAPSEILVVTGGGALRKGTHYVVRAAHNGELLARQTGLIDNRGRPVRGLPAALVNGSLAEAEAVWRGAFLAHGSLTEPGRSSSLEITCPGPEAAMALVDVVRAGERTRLRVCAARDCPDVLVDLSRNRSRRYCSTQCGNLVNVRDMRARR